MSAKSPVFTRLKIDDFIDIGGHLTIKIGFDEPVIDTTQTPASNVTQEIQGCISHLRPPRVTQSGVMICDNREATFRLENVLDGVQETSKVIPYPGMATSNSIFDSSEEFSVGSFDKGSLNTRKGFHTLSMVMLVPGDILYLQNCYCR